ncbi:hypothetical protein [Natronorubrum sp. FCH18a]|uniref:hypothetical protein n=1 Tax=Natronorubrum sp. FCH18a TaxID=3447018 RepID=UPI003F5138F6
MSTEDELSVRTVSSLQEAIDSIVQAFDYPRQLSIQYASVDGRKVTTIEIEGDRGVETFEMQFKGNEPDDNPVLKRVTDSR